MLLGRGAAVAAAVCIVGCSCTGNGSVASSGAGAGGASGRAGTGGSARGGSSGEAAAGSSGAGSGSAGSTVTDACGVAPTRPSELPTSFETVRALGCECTFWLGTVPADLPTVSWAPCGPGVPLALGCEKLEISGHPKAVWDMRADRIIPDTTNGGAPLLAPAAARDFYKKQAVEKRWWLDLASSTMRLELAADRIRGGCLMAAHRIAPGILTSTVNESTEIPGKGFEGHSGFVSVSVPKDGPVVYTASDPFQGTSNYTPTSDSVYGRLLDNTSGGIYRAEGTNPRGTGIDTSPFGAAFPYIALGGDFLIDLQVAGYGGYGLYNPTVGFQALLPPSPTLNRAASNLGGDGSVYVWTDQRDQIKEFRFSTNDVFTAPATTSPQALAATARRVTKTAVPRGAVSPWAVGCGYAAERWEYVLQVVRLSDGASWRQEHVGGPTNFLSPMAITCEHIYGTLDSGESARIRLDMLGEPLPAE